MGFSIALGQTAPIVALIAQMITPAIFILATGNLVNSAMARIGRVFDRARALIERAKEARESGDHATFELMQEELRSYRHRADWLDRALTFYYVAIGLFVLASLSIALNALIGDRLAYAPAIITVLGAMSLLGGSLAILTEARLATGVLRREIDQGIAP
jgi:hypothetical protein